MPTDFLNLPAFRVVRVEESMHDYHVTSEPVATQVACTSCGSENFGRWGSREQLIRDLPSHGKRVGIYVDTQRYRCNDCGKTFFHSLPAVSEKRQMTERLVNWIGQQAIKRTFLSLAEETGVDEKTIRNIFRDYVNELEKTVRFETPKWMGIDEIHLTQYRCVIANIENNTIVDLLHNRNKETVVKYLSQLQGREKIQYVAMDMWAPYRDAVNLVLPNATIVIDKFHVVRMASDAMEKVRKSLRESLTPKQRRGLMHDRFVLLKRESKLTDQDVLNLSGWVKNYPELGLAYRLKEDFFKIYDSQSKEEALARYAAWEISVTEEVRDAFSDLIKAWRNWQPHILAYFDHHITNAYTESLNSLIRVMDRLGRGYSFEALRAKVLFAEGTHKKSQKRPAFERRAPPSIPSLGRHMVGFKSLVSTNYYQNQAEDESEEPKNYGVDIAMLTRMIENGEI